MKITKLPGIEDKIKTWKDICEYLKIDNIKSLPYKNPTNKTERYINACFKLSKLSEVLNNGTVLDFNNNNQLKHTPYFRKEASGWVLYSYLSWTYGAYSGFGSYFKTPKLALYAGKQFFNEIYFDYLPE